MIRSLDELFALLANDAAPAPSGFSGSLFAEFAAAPAKTGGEVSAPWLGVISGFYTDEALNLRQVPETAARLFEISANAFDALVHAWMSERPIDAAMLRFGRKILAACDRNAAGKIAADRGDSDTLAVLDAAHKVRHEVHRLLGFLRFSPGNSGVYTARCAPDHFSLPAFAGHFTRRFGEHSGVRWIIIDEKRGRCLYRPAGGMPRLCDLDETALAAAACPSAHGWENLWKQYHQTINNESRNNPVLQNRFMPKRYRKYLPERE